MPLKKLTLKPGVNRENTRYTNENGWYECDKIRFRQGTPEKLGGWARLSSATFSGICRSLWNWFTLSNQNILGVGTNEKFYLELGGAYYDITPIRGTATLTNPFATTNTLTLVTVTDVAHGCVDGDYVTFSGASAVGGLTLNNEYQVTVVDADTYTITAATAATSTATGGGTVTATYQINVGPAVVVPLTGWGAGAWGFGTWGNGQASTEALRLWSQSNFGENLVFASRGGPIYYWAANANPNIFDRGIEILAGSDMDGLLPFPTVVDSTCPDAVNFVMVSDSSRFVIAFGANDPTGLYSTQAIDPMQVRWSDQESVVNWTPAATNQSGSVRLSHGSAIIGVAQVRQEIIVWTDTSIYSLQYLGPPIVWGSQLLADNITLISDRAMSTAAGVTYWMGEDKFYIYDGRIQTLPCALRQYVFSDFNLDQADQVFASTVERFNEVWWFYPSADSMVNDKYVVYNYIEQIWYYGTMERSSWIDASVVSDYPISAADSQLLYQESGVDDGSSGVNVPIPAYITSSEFDIDDGHNFGFVWRVLPDITFRGSTAASPQALLTLLPLQNSGSGYNNPQSVAGSSSGMITRSATVPVEQFTGQVNIRVRGRQMSLKIASEDLGVAWQLGAPRIDLKSDGRR